MLLNNVVKNNVTKITNIIKQQYPNNINLNYEQQLSQATSKNK